MKLLPMVSKYTCSIAVQRAEDVALLDLMDIVALGHKTYDLSFFITSVILRKQKEMILLNLNENSSI